MPILSSCSLNIQESFGRRSWLLADGAAGRSSLFRPLKNDARDTSFLLLEMTANKLAEDEREQRAFEMKFGQRGGGVSLTHSLTQTLFSPSSNFKMAQTLVTFPRRISLPNHLSISFSAHKRQSIFDLVPPAMGHRGCRRPWLHPEWQGCHQV